MEGLTPQPQPLGPDLYIHWPWIFILYIYNTDAYAPFLLQINGSDEKDIYEEYLTQGEIQDNINRVNGVYNSSFSDYIIR